MKKIFFTLCRQARAGRRAVAPLVPHVLLFIMREQFVAQEKRRGRTIIVRLMVKFYPKGYTLSFFQKNPYLASLKSFHLKKSN